jgi:hypothetical protein
MALEVRAAIAAAAVAGDAGEQPIPHILGVSCD